MKNLTQAKNNNALKKDKTTTTTTMMMMTTSNTNTRPKKLVEIVWEWTKRENGVSEGRRG